MECCDKGVEGRAGWLEGCMGVWGSLMCRAVPMLILFFSFFFFKGGRGFGGINSLEAKEGFYVCVQKLQTERRCLV